MLAILGTRSEYREWCFILQPRFSFFVPVDKTIYLPVFLVPTQVKLGFCITSYAEFQSDLLTLLKGVILVVKPYIILYVFTMCPRISQYLYSTDNTTCTEFLTAADNIVE